MFGYTKPSRVDLLQFWPMANSHREYADLIFESAKQEEKKEVKVKKEIIVKDNPSINIKPVVKVEENPKADEKKIIDKSKKKELIKELFPVFG